MSETVREYDVRVHGVDPYAVPCPLCDAKVDELCSSAFDGPRNGAPHVVRLEAARVAIEVVNAG